MMDRARWTWWLIAVAALGGCGPVRRAERVPVDGNIVALRTFCKNTPWMSLDAAGDRNPEGIKITCYAVSGANRRGANADGMFRFKLYTVDSLAEPPTSRLATSWEFNTEQAQAFRVTREIEHLGWPYCFILNWGDADVYGQEIRLVPEFVRPDGRTVTGSSKSFRVPQRVDAPIVQE